MTLAHKSFFIETYHFLKIVRAPAALAPPSLTVIVLLVN